MSMLKRELIYFGTALMFFTRIPVPVSMPYDERIMNASQRYFSWVGMLVGLINAALWLLLASFFSTSIAVLLCMSCSILLTGAFHEDGFTDVCDSFGGGYGAEKILHIMKDSRIGAYGVIGIVMLLLLKFSALSDLSILNKKMMPVFFIFAHTASRFMALSMIYTHRYVRDTDLSKSKPMANQALPPLNLLFAVIPILVVILFSKSYQLLLALPPMYIGTMLMGYYFKKHIGGYTGDCLGAVQQVTEVIFYLTAFLVCRYTF